MRQAGATAQAVAALQRAAQLDPQRGDIALMLGETLLGAGRPADALSWLDRAALLAPASPTAHIRRGTALEQLGWHREAAEAYRSGIAIAPRLAEAHWRLGIILLVQQQRASAAESFRRAAAIKPNSVLGRLARAYALIAAGAAAEAGNELRQLIAREPQNALAHIALGQIMAEAGDAGAAFAAYEQATRLDPRAAGHFYDLARIRRLTEADRPLIDRMRATAARSDLHVIQRVMLELAIGKACDDLDDPAEAVRWVIAANRRKATVRPLDRTGLTTRVDRQISTFTADFLARRRGVGSPSRKPLLIIGMPRSGTTLVESILASHREVGAGEELAFWNRHGRRCLAEGAPPLAELASDIAEAYLALLADISSRPFVTDKKPDNFVWAGLIHTVFPHARIIHCRRHPLDTCASILQNFFTPRDDFSTDPSDLVFYYRQYERLMAHWRAVLPDDQFLELDYESLIADPEAMIRRLLRFCGLEWEASCLTPERSLRTVTTASLWQVRQPIFRGSVGRWKRYAPWLGPLRALATEEESALIPAGD